MNSTLNKQLATVKVYNGYGHKGSLILMGHVLFGKSIIRKKYSSNVITNIKHLVLLFFIKPMSNAKLMLQWQQQQLYTTTASDGFFKFEWQSDNDVTAGWHSVAVNLINTDGEILNVGEGKIFIPHSTQYAFISDIDDTIIVSHAATTFKRLRTLFTKNPLTRKIFNDVVLHYHLLSLAHTEPTLLNPFFYVSNSEWNLYNEINDFFEYNKLPDGVFLLSEIKQWHQLFKSGKSKHEAKLIRIERILETFPKQQFILLGDNGQSDADIYVAIANKYPDKIVAIYIRNIVLKNEIITNEKLASVQNKNIYTCHFKNTNEAVLFSTSIGLID